MEALRLGARHPVGQTPADGRDRRTEVGDHTRRRALGLGVGEDPLGDPLGARLEGQLAGALHVDRGAARGDRRGERVAAPEPPADGPRAQHVDHGGPGVVDDAGDEGHAHVVDERVRHLGGDDLAAQAMGPHGRRVASDDVGREVGEQVRLHERVVGQG